MECGPETSLIVSEDWALIVLEQQHVLVQPGWFYDFTDDRIVVVSLLTKEDELAEGIKRLVHCASTYGVRNEPLTRQLSSTARHRETGR